MWTRGRDDEQPGRFAYELFDMDGSLIERVGGFATHTECERAAERAQRRAIFPVEADFVCAMTNEELLRELLS